MMLTKKERTESRVNLHKSKLNLHAISNISFVLIGILFTALVVAFINPSFFIENESQTNTTLAKHRAVENNPQKLGTNFSTADSELITSDTHNIPSIQFNSGMTGAEIKVNLSEMAAAALRDGDAQMAFDLSERLRACSPKGLQRRLDHASNGRIQRADALGYPIGTAEEITNQHRLMCDGLNSLPPKLADDLLASARGHQFISAVVETSIIKLHAIEEHVAAYRQENPKINMDSTQGNQKYIPPGAPEVIAELNRLAEGGNSAAMTALADAYRNGLAVAENETMATTYQLLSIADWSRPGSQFENNRLLDGVSPVFKKNVLNETNRIMKICCHNVQNKTN